MATFCNLTNEVFFVSSWVKKGVLTVLEDTIVQPNEKMLLTAAYKGVEWKVRMPNYIPVGKFRLDVAWDGKKAWTHDEKYVITCNNLNEFSISK